MLYCLLWGSCHRPNNSNEWLGHVAGLIVKYFVSRLKNSKQELLDQSEEAARLKRDNAELEFRIQQANEGHKLNVELLTGQIEEVRSSVIRN